MSGLLTGPQTVQFGSVLFAAYTPASLTTLCLSVNQPPYETLVSLNADFGQATLELVLRANREGWVPSLLKAVKAELPDNHEVKLFFANHTDLDPAANPQVADPWMVYRLFGGRLFLGRMQVRQKLRKMNDPLNRKVLVVRSDRRQVGKTYSGALVGLVCEQLGHTTTYIDLDARGFDLQSLAEELALKWEIDLKQLPKQGEEQKTRWAQQLGSFLVSNAPAKNGLVRWLILDGFRERVPAVGVKTLIEQLMIDIQSTSLFRLIITNYNDPLPIEVLSFIDKVDALTLPEIQAALVTIHQSSCGHAATVEEIADYMETYTERLAEYKLRSPEHAESHLLIHNAAADVVEEML